MTFKTVTTRVTKKKYLYRVAFINDNYDEI